MATRTLDAEQMRQLIVDTITASDFRRATFAGVPRLAASPWQRIIIRPVMVRGSQLLQFSWFDERKDTSKNIEPSAVRAALDEVLAFGYSGVHLWTATEEIDLRLSKKGKVICQRQAIRAVNNAPTHNRTKEQPLPEGRADHLLETLGIMTADGIVRPTMRAKYTQINEFLKHLSHVLDDAGLRTLDRPITILDCGCGSSYLTLAVHHYLHDILTMPATVIGVDINPEVIRKSTERAQQLDAEAITFTCGKIGAMEVTADIVLALHACDTATDDAIAQAIRSEARLLLSVPCCHHHLNEQIGPHGAAEVLRPILRQPILQQRTADLVTDALRALILRIMGYRTEIVEFVSPEHTARNLLIRAVRTTPVGEPSFVREYQAMCAFWGVRPYLESALGEPFQRWLHPG